jgi:hypothetical protein
MNETDQRIMDFVHKHRVDTARHHIQAWKNGEWAWRFLSSEAAMFFFNDDNNAVTVNGVLR